MVVRRSFVLELSPLSGCCPFESESNRELTNSDDLCCHQINSQSISRCNSKLYVKCFYSAEGSFQQQNAKILVKIMINHDDQNYFHWCRTLSLSSALIMTTTSACRNSPLGLKTKTLSLPWGDTKIFCLFVEN